MDSDCRDDQGCIGKCVDLCPIACEDNSDCTMMKHQPICKCKPGYKGDPHTLVDTSSILVVLYIYGKTQLIPLGTLTCRGLSVKHTTIFKTKLLIAV